MKQVNYLLFPFDSPEGLAIHAIGLDGRHHPYHRHGKLFYKPWRNGFAELEGTRTYDTWKSLEHAGLARSYIDHRHRFPHTIFSLTRAGLDWLGGRLGITIHDEER